MFTKYCQNLTKCSLVLTEVGYERTQVTFYGIRDRIPSILDYLKQYPSNFKQSASVEQHCTTKTLKTVMVFHRTDELLLRLKEKCNLAQNKPIVFYFSVL